MAPARCRSQVPPVSEASAEVLVRARNLAADLLEADPADVVLDPITGRFHVAGSPSVDRTWADVATAAGPRASAPTSTSSPRGSTFPFGAHLAVVEVDAETGAVQLLRLVAVDDSGRLLNPLIAEGQRQGGIAQGVAQALFEEIRFDEDGNPVTSNFADYAIPSAAELPNFELIAMETPTPLNELGAKGIGESGTIGATPAVQNAVVDALAHLGIRHVDLPLTPERVWRSIQEAGPLAGSTPTTENGRRRRSRLLHAVRQGFSCPTGQIFRISQHAFGAELDPGKAL